MNIRKPLAKAAFRLTRPGALDKMNFVKGLDQMNESELAEYQDRRLSELLRHAYETVPYYREILKEHDVVSDESVDLTKFSELPLLTKDVMREQEDRLYSSKPNEGVFRNTSGGTTGEPVEFLQDQTTLEWENANRRYYLEGMAGRELGEPWIKLWGSERDLFDERKPIKDQISDFVLNRHFLNSYQMGDEDMAQYVNRINELEPATIEAYVESMNELAKYIEREELAVYSPNTVLTTAGTLHQPVRDRIESVFDTTVLNKYGSREVGDVACECPHQEGLHVFEHTHYVEVVDETGTPLPPGEEGELAITVLTNYSMPLIRYRLGDRGMFSQGGCSCSRTSTTLERVSGRVSDHFLSTDQRLVYGGAFRLLLFNKDWVRKFQIRQEKRDEVVYYIICTESSTPSQEDIRIIQEKTKHALGENINVEFKFVDSLPPNESGKYRYTINELDLSKIYN